MYGRLVTPLLLPPRGFRFYSYLENPLKYRLHRLVMVPEYVNGYQQNKEALFPVAPTGLEFSVEGNHNERDLPQIGTTVVELGAC